MDTQEIGTNSTEENLSGNSSTDQSDETTTSDTSEDGADAETLRKRLADKDRYIKELESGKRKAKSEPEDDDDVMTWLTVNADDLKLVNKEYKEELQFYKTHKIPVTNEIRDRALREAKNRKGVRSEAQEQQSVTSEVKGEMRRTTRQDELPATIAKLSPTMDKDKYAKYKAEFRERGLKV